MIGGSISISRRDLFIGGTVGTIIGLVVSEVKSSRQSVSTDRTTRELISLYPSARHRLLAEERGSIFQFSGEFSEVARVHPPEGTAPGRLDFLVKIEPDGEGSLDVVHVTLGDSGTWPLGGDKVRFAAVVVGDFTADGVPMVEVVRVGNKALLEIL